MKPLVKFCLALLICGAASIQNGFAQQTTNAQSALDEARALITSGNPSAAIAKLQTLSPANDPRVAQLLGLAFYTANDHVKAVEQLSSAVAKLPKDSAAWRESVQLLGLSNFLLGKMADAVPFLEQAVVWQQNNNELVYALGMACVQARQPEKARAAFGRMFRVEPDSAAAHLLTAQMMIRVEMEDLADVELKKALEKDPRLPQANYLLAQNAIYKNRFDEGVALLEKELAINPNNAMAYYKIGDAMTRQLKWDDAIVQLQKSVWLNPFYSGPYILLGKSYLKKRQLTNAEGMLKRAIQFDPNNKSAHYILGQVYQQAGKAEDAKREFALAEKLQGNLENPEIK